MAEKTPLKGVKYGFESHPSHLKLLSGPTGPYEHGYLMCRVKYPSGRIKMVTYHKYLYEDHYGVLSDNMVVHHIDEDKSNNDLSNLEAKTQEAHSREHRIPKEIWKLRCLQCSDIFFREARKERHSRKQGKSGPFCCKSCAAIGSR